MTLEDLQIILGVEIPCYEALKGKNRDGITAAQKEYLHVLGVNVTGIRYKGQASIIITVAQARKEAGLATMKQLQTLYSLGCKPKKPFQYITKEEASGYITRYLK